MQRGKLNILLLALLVAAMAMVPMVSAANEQIIDGDKLQLSQLKPDDSQMKTVIQNGYSLTDSDYQTEVPEGSIIHHSKDGITRVYNAEGKQLLVSKDSDSPQLDTPYGLISAEKINQIPDGSYVQVNDNGITNVYLDDKRILTVIAPASDDIAVPASDGWIESAQSWGIPQMGQFIADWTVPSSPPDSTTRATNYIFNGIQPGTSSGIVQPVLEYNVYKTNHQWTAAPWYVDSSGMGYRGTPINTATGHSIRGTLGWNPNLNRWNIIVQDLSNGGFSSSFSTNAPNIGTNNVGAVCALEGYDITNNNDVSGKIIFRNMQFRDVNLNPVSFSWSKQVNNNMGLTNLDVTWSGMTPVTLRTNNP